MPMILQSPELKHNPIPGMLVDARNHLLWCRARLVNARALRAWNPNYDRTIERLVERDFLAALDRVHDVQSMTIASF